MTALFADSPLGLACLDRLQAIVDDLGGGDLRVARTQIGWARRRGFAFLWRPSLWLDSPAADVVLSIATPRRIDSARWKQVIESRPGLFLHHLELHSADEIDDEVAGWLAEAYEAAG